MEKIPYPAEGWLFRLLTACVIPLDYHFFMKAETVHGAAYFMVVGLATCYFWVGREWYFFKLKRSIKYHNLAVDARNKIEELYQSKDIRGISDPKE